MKPNPPLLTYSHPLDAEIAQLTGFSSMSEMLNEKGGYFPSLYTFRRPLKQIADEYDRLQTARGDHRRAFRHNR